MKTRLLVRSSWLATVVVLLAATASRVTADDNPAPTAVFAFPECPVTFRADFPGGRLSDCQRRTDGSFRLGISPETAPINDSAWYAFQVQSETPRTLTLQLTYEHGKHRYHPKVSRDGKAWRRLSADQVRIAEDQRSAVITLEVGRERTWIAAQELITENELFRWIDELAEHSRLRRETIGRSVEERPIRLVQIGADHAKYLVVAIGRQHPPEVTGSVCLMAFAEALCEDSVLARRFRENVRVAVVPLVNPDGVQRGNWRCNQNGVDLNRDWGPFAQAETGAVRDWVHRQTEQGLSVKLWLDFHSTHRDVFYTQSDDQPTGIAEFTREWLDSLQRRLPDYRVRREPTSKLSMPTSANWAHLTYRIPSITYETGDNTDREQIRVVARAAAEEMMRLLLSYLVDDRVNIEARPDHRQLAPASGNQP